MLVTFAKMHGAGNDFVVIDDRKEGLRGREAELARKLCRRRFSIGADGLIILRESKHKDCHIAMQYYNADGSYSGMCGNGLRCVAWYYAAKVAVSNEKEKRSESSGRADTRESKLKATQESSEEGISGGFDRQTHNTRSGITSFFAHLFPSYEGLSARLPMEVIVEADDEARRTEVMRITGSVEAEVRVDMGAPRLALGDIPATIPDTSPRQRWINKPLGLLSDFRPYCTLVSMGNPHCVIFVDEGELTDEIVLSKGASIQALTELFPQRINVEFAKITEQGRRVKLRVYERGVGETLACASGACATVVAGILSGRLAPHEEIKVELAGGTFTVSWEAEDESSVILTGNAVIVYEGMVAV